MSILEESKKLKINLEVNETNKPKLIYSNSFTLNELILLNNNFEKFKDYSEAFNYLIKNYTKIDKNKIIPINNNEINLTLFSNNEIEKNSKNNDIIEEESIEVILYSPNKNYNK